MLISIIVPIYHGKKYIKDMITQVEANQRNILCKLELLFINDDPTVPIDENIYSDVIQIYVFNTKINRGIHGARVKGLNKATGKYILFLDQDDQISENYIKKQLNHIGDADAVICKAFQNNRDFYYQDIALNECISKYYITQEGNFIISPGQVLIKKNAIPIFWKENILKYNGADDWFLWICMFCAGKRFVCNQETLFNHIVHARNTSANGFSMINSMREVYERLKVNTDCTEKELIGIKRIVQKHENNYILERDKFLELYFLLDDWMTIREQERNLSDYIRGQGYKMVCIYGKGRIGLRLAKELQSEHIGVKCFIDRNASLLRDEFVTIVPEKIEDIQEPVIVTLARNDALLVREMLREKGIMKIYILSDIIEYLKNCNVK